MPSASYVQSSFIGGEYSKFMQGRYDRPEYRTGLNVCLNSIPLETGTLVRRPGFRFLATTRNGNPGRAIKFDFQQNAPYTMEFSDGYLRFIAGLVRADTNDTVQVFSISGTNPCIIGVTPSETWVNGQQVYFTGQMPAIFQNRDFVLFRIDNNNFQPIDPITNASIDGTTLNGGNSIFPIAGTTFAHRILEELTPYTSGLWKSLRSVQTETTAFLLHGQVQPYAVTVNTQPTSTAFATFGFATALFNDGPYLDPPTNGAQLSPSAVSGNITLSLAFPAWVSTTSYAKGAFVTENSTNWQSIADQNVGNTPHTDGAVHWVAVSSGLAINNGQGFLGTDIGRLVRMFSEPDLWAAGSTYAKGATVSYNPSGQPGQVTYWNSLVSSNTGNVPGTDLVNWQLLVQGGTSSPAIWSWGKIISLANQISNVTGSNIGTLTGNGGVNAAFDGSPGKAGASCAALNLNASTIDGYVGKNYTGAGGEKIEHATVYPSNDSGFAVGTSGSGHGGGRNTVVQNVVVELRGKASAPTSSSDGTLLATSGVIANTTAAITLVSSDQTTTWNYIWIRIIASFVDSVSGLPEAESGNTIFCAQDVNFNPPGSGNTANAVTLQILGAPLLYTTPIRTWRFGLYSNTTGWPTCGTYIDGRLILSGVLANRIDGSVSNGVGNGINGINAGTVNFAPTDQYGNVLASSAISAVFNAPDTNPIFWLSPDQQGIVCGTKAGEWLVFAPTAGGLSPLNISVRRMTTIGCANVEPRKTEHTTVFVQKFGRKIMEYFADVFSGKYTAPHITYTCKHLTIGNVAELAYQQELAPLVWGRISSATALVPSCLIGITYKRDTLMTSQGPSAAGGHRHQLGSGRIVESVAVGASTGGNVDALTIISNDPATGIRHIELLTDILDEGSTPSQAWFLDDAVVPASTSTSNTTPTPYGGLTLNGLWHLNGKTVTAWLGGLDCGDYTVSNGSITVPYGSDVYDPTGGTANGLFSARFVSTGLAANGIQMFIDVMPMVVGFTYNSDAQPVRPHSPQESGARSGPALGKKRRSNRFAIQVEGTAAVSIGTDFNYLDPVNFRDPADNAYPLNRQFTGVFADALTDKANNDLGYDSLVCWRTSRPYICNVAAISGFLETSDGV